MTPDERRLNRIIRGQVRSYMNDHPEMFSKCGLGKQGRNNVEGGIAKRIFPEVSAVLRGCGTGMAATGCKTVPPSQAPSGVLPASAPEGQPLTGFWQRVRRWFN